MHLEQRFHFHLDGTVDWTGIGWTGTDYRSFGIQGIEFGSHGSCGNLVGVFVRSFRCRCMILGFELPLVSGSQCSLYDWFCGVFNVKFAFWCESVYIQCIFFTDGRILDVFSVNLRRTFGFFLLVGVYSCWKYRELFSPLFLFSLLYF
jgi:hypothetical protein